MVPAGTYRARAVGQDGVQYGFTGTGNAQLAVEFELLEEGERVTWFGVFAPGKSSDIAMRALRAAGWTGDDLNDLVGLGSTEVELVIEDEEWNGKVRTRVRWVNVPGAGGRVELQSKMNDAQRRAFAERMRSQAIASRPNAGGQVVGPRRPKPTPPMQANPPALAGQMADDDIPF